MTPGFPFPGSPFSSGTGSGSQSPAGSGTTHAPFGNDLSREQCPCPRGGWSAIYSLRTRSHT